MMCGETNMLSEINVSSNYYRVSVGYFNGVFNFCEQVFFAFKRGEGRITAYYLSPPPLPRRITPVDVTCITVY